MKFLVLGVALFAATTGVALAAPIVTMKTEAPAGDYTLDKSHGSLIFRVDHIGFSNYTARFASFDAKLKFDPKDPAKSSVTATIDPNSLDLFRPPEGFLASLKGPEWLDVVKFPAMTFRSTKVEVTGPNTARVAGAFGFHGVTKPVVLNATFNGGYAGHPYDPQARIGFSAQGTLKRSDFGVAYGIPEPGTKMGVSDEVQIIIEAEFNGPKLPGAPAPLPAH